MAVLTRELGVDLGTSNTVFAEGNQVLLQEPTMVAILIEEEKMVEWGQAAKDMFMLFMKNFLQINDLRNFISAAGPTC